MCESSFLAQLCRWCNVQLLVEGYKMHQSSDPNAITVTVNFSSLSFLFLSNNGQVFHKYETCHTHSLSCLFLIPGQSWMLQIVQSKVMLGTRIAQKEQKLSVRVIWIGMLPLPVTAASVNYKDSLAKMKPSWRLLLVTVEGSIAGYGKC